MSREINNNKNREAMKLTQEKLKALNPCSSGYEWYIKFGKEDISKICKGLIKDNHSDWANWTLTHLLTKEQCVLYAIFSAKLVIKIYEDKYPNDDRPRKAIEAAEKYLELKAGDAARAAWAAGAAGAARAAWAAGEAAWAAGAARAARAAWATREAAWAAGEAAWATRDAAWAAGEAAWATRDAAWAAAFIKTQTKIINYGIKLLNTNLG